MYNVIVSVGGAPTQFLSAQWSYAPPAVTTITPAVLSPVPDDNTTLLITGANFGTVLGAVTVGGRSTECWRWSDAVIECAAPRGVVAAAAVIVTAASQVSSSGGTYVTYAYGFVSSCVVHSIVWCGFAQCRNPFYLAL